MTEREALAAEFRLYAGQWGGGPRPGEGRATGWPAAYTKSPRDLFNRVLAALEATR